jgi:regulator of protease activity HflC (stomatin/prohibitin superfamily)
MALRGSRPAPRAVAEEVLALPAGSAIRAYLEARRDVVAWLRVLETRAEYERKLAQGDSRADAMRALAMREGCCVRTIRNRLDITAPGKESSKSLPSAQGTRAA